MNRFATAIKRVSVGLIALSLLLVGGQLPGGPVRSDRLQTTNRWICAAQRHLLEVPVHARGRPNRVEAIKKVADEYSRSGSGRP